MSLKFTFYDAVNALDDYLQRKTTHSTQRLLEEMRNKCEYDFVSPEDQQDFANMCSNFDKYVQETGRTSIGRKQFEEWWEVQGTGTAGDWSDEALAELQEDELPDLMRVGDDMLGAAVKRLEAYSKTVDNSKTAHDLKVENTELRNEVNKLKAELKAANDKLEAIRGIILWG